MWEASRRFGSPKDYSIGVQRGNDSWGRTDNSHSGHFSTTPEYDSQIGACIIFDCYIPYREFGSVDSPIAPSHP
jgi:hypothetical protein